MAFLGGLLGGGGSDPMDIYGDLFTEKQRAALRDQQLTAGLLNAAAVFSKAGQASRLPVSIPWGEAAQALGGSGDEAMARMLKGMQVAEEVRTSRQQREVLAKAAPYVEAIMKQFDLDRPAATKVATQIASAQGGAPAGGQAVPNAPPSGPQPSTGLVPPEGLPGGATSGAGAEWLPTLSPAAVPPLRPIPPAPPGGRITPADYGVTNPQGAGLLGEPSKTDPLTQYAGLLGGGTGSQPPFDLASLGAAGGGLPDLSNIKIEQLSGEAAPAGGREGRVAFWTAQGAPQHVAEAIADRVKAESGFNPSIMGDQGTSGGLYQHHADRLTRLKNYAAQQGRPWTDPGVQDQFAATEVRGGDAIAAKGWPAILNAPDRQTAATLWDKYFERSAAGPGSGGGGRTGIRIEPLGGEAVPAGAGGGPQTLGGVRPEALAALNAMLKMGGIKSDPFGSLLETYYKSPGYLGEAARTEAEARKQIEQKYDPIIEAQKTAERLKVETELRPRLEAEIERAKNDPKLAYDEKKAIIDRKTEELRALGVAATSSKEVVVEVPGRPPEKRTLTNEQILRLNSGQALPEINLPAGARLSEPYLSPEQQAAQTQRGKTGEEMREVQVWTPTGLVTQQMRNLEIETRRKLAAERGAGGPPQIGDIVDKPAMNPADQKIADALGEDFITLRRQAIAADKTIRDTHNLRSKIDSGMFTGLDANINLFLARLGDTMGWKNLSDADKVKNTQTYIAGLGSEVLAMVKDLKPASNVDLQFASQMAGSQNLSAASIRQLLDMREEYARLAIQRHNDEAAGRNPAIFQGARRELPMPPAYQPKELTTPGGNKVIINR